MPFIYPTENGLVELGEKILLKLRGELVDTAAHTGTLKTMSSTLV